MPFELRDLGLVKLFFADVATDADAGSLLVASGPGVRSGSTHCRRSNPWPAPPTRGMHYRA
ncbi:MAG TPA: hypothetical protein VG244_13895 [Acidimicrobiales bacterium]|nr:hypothetical protein [Acidimicrobiales bacterium]